jgi:hypothetical protein
MDRDGPCALHTDLGFGPLCAACALRAWIIGWLRQGHQEQPGGVKGPVKLNPTRNLEAAPHQSPWPPPETHKYSPTLRNPSISRPGADFFLPFCSLRLALRAPSSASVPRHHRHLYFRHIHTVKMRGEVRRPHTTVALWFADMAPHAWRLLQGGAPFSGRRPPR